MSIWWVDRDQLDESQISLVEDEVLDQHKLVMGPPGSGKTNVLLRRAQFVRFQEMPNVVVLTYTRALTEFIKTGCYNQNGDEIFPESCVTTIESWIRSLYEEHGAEMPDDVTETERKRVMAVGALGFKALGEKPSYDALFVDEAQDLLPEEVSLISQWGNVLFFAGDDRQQIHQNNGGWQAVNSIVSPANKHLLSFHYRLAPEICRVADRIRQTADGETLDSTSHYVGPRPGRVRIEGPKSKPDQMTACADRLKEQIRVYADLIARGDRIGIIVARTADRDLVFGFLERDPELAGKSKIIRARNSNDDADFDPSFEPDKPICIVTLQGSKGLEFRAVHWLFCEELSQHHGPEHYYTVVTRAKTTLDISYTCQLPDDLARAYSPEGRPVW